MKYSTSPTPMSNYPRSTSPLPAPANHSNYQPTTASAAAKRYKYIRRLFKFNQMDFEFAAWQMVYLFVAPQKVFRNFNYRKHTKSQFARDDPAFLVLLSVWMLLTSICFGLAMNMTAVNIVLLVIYVVFVDFIGVGLLVSTIFWYVCNKYLRRDPDGPDVEWGYAFDVHINAFFPPLSLLHFFQIILFNNLVYPGGFFFNVVSNAFWLASIIYYLYITFLGYSMMLSCLICSSVVSYDTHVMNSGGYGKVCDNDLPILQNARIFLLPLPLLFIAYFVTIMLDFNLSHLLMHFYKMRLL